MVHGITPPTQRTSNTCMERMWAREAKVAWKGHGGDEAKVAWKGHGGDASEELMQSIAGVKTTLQMSVIIYNAYFQPLSVPCVSPTCSIPKVLFPRVLPNKLMFFFLPSICP